jgi:hypothetical protein
LIAAVALLSRCLAVVANQPRLCALVDGNIDNIDNIDNCKGKWLNGPVE